MFRTNKTLVQWNVKKTHKDNYNVDISVN
jgi:hypothetical protein